MLLEPFLSYTPYLALLVRLYMGVAMTVHGYPKMTGAGRARAVEFMRSVGVPGTAAVLSSILEFIGGLFLIAGLIVPVVGLFFALQFASITVLKKRTMKSPFISPGGPSYEIDVVYLVFSIVLVVLGAGALSFDSALGL
ncbi:MAG: DoxX family protein [Nitrososphaerales archaeon]